MHRSTSNRIGRRARSGTAARRPVTGGPNRLRRVAMLAAALLCLSVGTESVLSSAAAQASDPPAGPAADEPRSPTLTTGTPAPPSTGDSGAPRRGDDDAPSAEAPATPPNASTPAPATTVVPAWRQAERIVVLPVTGGIDRVTLWSLERRMAAAIKSGADAVVIELDTPGGEMTATLDICNLLKDSSETPGNVVAWVNDDAYSAGAIISLACREIIVSPTATLGDAAPIQVLGGLGMAQMAAPERAKIEAPLLAEVIDSARRNHYDENLVQSFVSVGIELWMLQHRTTGERIFVTEEEYVDTFGEAPPQQIASLATGAVPAGRVAPKLGRVRGSAGPGGPGGPGATPTPPGAPTAQNAAVAQYQQQLPPLRDPLTAADRDDWVVVEHVITDERLLTLKAPELIDYGFAAAIVADDAELAAFFAARDVTRLKSSWSEGLVRFLISFPVRIVLIIMFILGFLLEAAAPGTTVFGAIAIVSLLVLLGAPMLIGAAGWWDVLLIAIGMVLVLVELFVIPGTGIAGFLGGAMVLTGLVMTFVSGDIGTPDGNTQLWKGMLATLTAIFGAGVGVWLLSRQFYNSPMLKRLVLQTDADGHGAGVRSATVLSAAGPVAQSDEVPVGSVGITQCDLRPAGRAEFDGRLIDVQSAGPYIETGMPVRIVGQTGGIPMVEIAE